MTVSKIIGFSVIGLIAVYILRLKNTISDLNYSVAGITLDFDGPTPVLVVALRLENVHSTSFILKALAGNLLANNSPVGSVENYVPVTVQPLSSVIYPLRIKLFLVAIASDIVNAFTGGGGQMQVQFQGQASIDNIVAPVDFKYTIG